MLSSTAPAHSASSIPTEVRAPIRSTVRYCPARAFPAYRYVPGVQPHPTRDPAGHSYDPAPRRRHAPWQASDWRRLPEWLFGIDLFNAFYFWEAHEAWEDLWAVAPRTSPEGLTLQGLIQIAAALLKIHLGSPGGAASLSRDGLDKLAAAAAVDPDLLGLDLPRTIAEFHHYFRPLDQRTLPPLDPSVPRVLLPGWSDA